jgi:2-methylcitrate dehydratase PrpD
VTTEAQTDVAGRVGKFISAFRSEDIPADALEKTKDHFAYLLASAFTGYFTPLGKQARAAAARLGGGGAATIIGAGQAAAVDAAYANSVMMAAPGLDDFLLPAGVHPGQVTLPAALALAEQEHRSGRELLTALVVGYEVIGKLATLQWMWVAPTPRRATIPFGAFGPAAASAKLLELDAVESAHAVGFAANSAMGLSESPFLQQLYGFAARAGITSAVLAQTGAETPGSTFSGEYGFFNAYLGRSPEGLENVLASLGTDLEILKAQVKPYPTTGMNVTLVELVLGLIRAHRIKGTDVWGVRVRLSGLRANQRVGHARGPFTERSFAISSGPFNIAMALTDGRIDIARYDDYEDPELMRLAQATEVVLEDHGNLRRAWVEIAMNDGARYQAESDAFEVPMPERRAVLERDGLRLLGNERIARLEETIARLETVKDVTTVGEILRQQGVPPQIAP